MNEVTIKELIEFYDGTNKLVHLKLINGKFYNGLFVEWENESTFIFEDRVVGLIPILAKHVEVLEEFKRSSL